MKNYLNTFLLFSLLNLSITTLTMEEWSIDKPCEDKHLYELGLSIEIWNSILEELYFQPQILTKSEDIYEALGIIKKNITKYYKTISLVCKDLDALNMSRPEFKEKIKRYLNRIFLEQQEGKEGLYPKKSEWTINPLTNIKIAKFISKQTSADKFSLADIIEGGHSIVMQKIGDYPKATTESLISLAIFYGADPNTVNASGFTPLGIATMNHNTPTVNNTDIIRLLLLHNANPNLPLNSNDVPWVFAILSHHREGNIIIALLLVGGGDQNVKVFDKKTIKDFARDEEVRDFAKLVEIYSPKQTLKSICIKFILLRLPLFQDKLETVPNELKNLFKFN